MENRWENVVGNAGCKMIVSATRRIQEILCQNNDFFEFDEHEEVDLDTK
jgi:hypothetical protein